MGILIVMLVLLFLQVMGVQRTRETVDGGERVERQVGGDQTKDNDVRSTVKDLKKILNLVYYLLCMFFH